MGADTIKQPLELIGASQMTNAPGLIARMALPTVVNICRISVHRDGRTGRAIVFAVIDNLWKGAASQAVQNLNLMFGLDEREGIS